MYLPPKPLAAFLAGLLLIFAPLALVCEISAQRAGPCAGTHCRTSERDFDCPSKTALKIEKEGTLGAPEPGFFSIAVGFPPETLVVFDWELNPTGCHPPGPGKSFHQTNLLLLAVLLRI